MTEGEAAPAAPVERGSRNLLMRVLAAVVLAPIAIAIAWYGGWLWALLVMLATIGLYLEWLAVVGLAWTASDATGFPGDDRRHPVGNPSREEFTMDVVVVGSGIIGLTTAIRLQERGLRVVVVTADGLLSTTSAVAAAVWFPVATGTSGQVADWSATAFAEFARQAAEGVPGVSMRSTRMLAHQPQPAGLPWWGEAVPDLRRLTAAERGPDCADGWSFTAPAVEMPLYLPWLLGRFTDNGGEIVHRRLDTLGQALAWAPVVVNATGIGARRLCDDQAVHPVRGQLVLVSNPGLPASTRIQDDPAGYTYVHPRSSDVVLGGTFEPGDWNTVPDPATAEAILARCTARIPRLRGARVLGHAVGLRPARHGGPRLEADPDGRFVHNYGHGGAGVTLSWGCADAAAALVG